MLTTTYTFSFLISQPSSISAIRVPFFDVSLDKRVVHSPKQTAQGSNLVGIFFHVARIPIQWLELPPISPVAGPSPLFPFFFLFFPFFPPIVHTESFCAGRSEAAASFARALLRTCRARPHIQHVNRMSAVLKSFPSGRYLTRLVADRRER